MVQLKLGRIIDSFNNKHQCFDFVNNYVALVIQRISSNVWDAKLQFEMITTIQLKKNLIILVLKGCILHFIKWQILPFSPATPLYI